MRVESLLLAIALVAGACAAEELEPLSLEFLEFLGENTGQDEIVDLLIEVEGTPESGRPEAGAEEHE